MYNISILNSLKNGFHMRIFPKTRMFQAGIALLVELKNTLRIITLSDILTGVRHSHKFTSNM